MAFWGSRGTPHGNARWAREEDVRQAEGGLGICSSLDSSALLLGNWIPFGMGDQVHPMHQYFYEGYPWTHTGGKGVLVLHGEGHVMTIAPTRSGKGVGMVIPNLLNYAHHVVVIDPKGENYRATAHFRVETLGHRVWCFDPFRIAGSEEFHGICLLRRAKQLFEQMDRPSSLDGDEALAEIGRIAEAMVVRQKDEKQPFFNDAAQAAIKDALILLLWGAGSDEVRLSDMRPLFLDPKRVDDYYREVCEAIHLAGGVPSRSNMVAFYASKELKGYLENRDVVSTILLQTEFLEDSSVARLLEGSLEDCDMVLDPELLNEDGAGESIYLVVPPHHLTRQSRFLRLVLTTCMDVGMRRNTSYAYASGYRPMLFLLDEVAQLGKLDLIEKAVSLAAGYGVRLWMFWQDLAQLKSVYPESWFSFLSNARVQQFFGCNDLETAKYVSERAGSRTQTLYGETDSVGTHHVLASVSSSITAQRQVGELVRPAEVLRAGNEVVFAFCSGSFPILFEKIHYYEDERFKEYV